MGTFLDEVKSRRSVRTFDGRPVAEDLLQQLKDCAAKAVNPYHIPVTFDFFTAKEHGLSSPVLSGAETYVTAKVSVQKNADVAYGYSFQKLLMQAHHLGLGTVWIGGTMPREKFEKAAGVTDGEVMPCVSPLGYEAKMSLKEIMMRKGVKADTRYDFEQLFFLEKWNAPLTREAALSLGLEEALEAVRMAPSAVNKQPWRVIVSGKNIHFYEKKDRGYDNGTYDLQKVDVGIALFNFEETLKSASIPTTFTINDPAIPDLPEHTEYVATYTLN
ncbi:MAG: nitroreductase family protein [Lachnospiraceae bacterium]|nr:nitroreductase family protein [Lachnospiraceae bacterium]